MGKHVEKTISANILNYYYSKFADNYNSQYPDVKNPSALLNGVTSVTTAIGGGRLSSHTLLYILEDEADVINPLNARYIITITKDILKDMYSDNYVIRLFYTGTGEVESISTIEEDTVVWSPDNLENSQHPQRTQYYLGFVYMLCDKSPGFDEEPVADTELTLEDLIALGVEGELPAELIEISLDNEEEKESENEFTETEKDMENFANVSAVITDSNNNVDNITAEYDSLADDLFGEDFETEIQVEEDKINDSSNEIPEQDDTEVVLYTPEEIVSEYDDLATDYEELFDDEMFEF